MKGGLGFWEEEQERPVVCVQVSLGTRRSAGFCHNLAFTGGRAVGLEGAEATTSCHCHFITHLLIVANGDFTTPRALIGSCGSALMGAAVGGGVEGRPAWESLQEAHVSAWLAHLGPAGLSLGLITIW